MTPRPATHAETLAAVQALPAGRTRYVGVDGFGGAGKSTFATWLAGSVPGAVVVPVDHFASPSVPEWDWARLQREVLDPLAIGRPGHYERWDWASDAGAEWRDVPAGGVVVFEGVSSTRRELRLAWDVRIWVETPAELRLRRALDRDGPAVAALWHDRWIPEEIAWYERDQALDRIDLIIDGTELPPDVRPA